jgi:hypothetical protein
MLTCIFCSNELNARTKPEHILLNALGGRRTTKRVICSQCNQRFGGSIDAALTRQVAVLRNHLQLESGTGKAPPGLGRIRAGNDTIKINGDGSLELVGKPFTVTPLGDGRSNLQISAGSSEEIAFLVPHIAARIGTSEENVWQHLMAAQATVTSRKPDLAYFQTPFGGEDECRSLLKSCLVLWATLVGNDEVRSDKYEIAREHVTQLVEREAHQPLGPFAAVHLDSRPLPHIDALTARFGEFFNLIYVRSDALGRVVGHFTLYNLISWQFVLAESGGSPSLKVALASDPLNTSAWSDTIADEIDVEVDWLNNPDFDVSRTHDRLAALLARSQKDGMEREIGRIVAVVCEKNGIAPDGEIADPTILREISWRIAHHIANVPYQETISGQSLLGMKVRQGAGI